MDYTLKDICKCGKELDSQQVMLYSIFNVCPHPKSKKIKKRKNDEQGL